MNEWMNSSTAPPYVCPDWGFLRCCSPGGSAVKYATKIQVVPNLVFVSLLHIHIYRFIKHCLFCPFPENVIISADAGSLRDWASVLGEMIKGTLYIVRIWHRVIEQKCLHNFFLEDYDAKPDHFQFDCGCRPLFRPAWSHHWSSSQSFLKKLDEATRVLLYWQRRGNEHRRDVRYCLYAGGPGVLPTPDVFVRWTPLLKPSCQIFDFESWRSPPFHPSSAMKKAHWVVCIMPRLKTHRRESLVVSVTVLPCYRNLTRIAGRPDCICVLDVP